jgi:hypothetical protein
MFANLRNRILAMPSRLTMNLVNVSSPAKVKVIIEREARACCTELCEIAMKSAEVEE